MAPKREPLTMEDREDISRGLAKGLDNKDIAASIGRDESVVSREIARHGGREAYRAWKAGAAARESRSRPTARIQPAFTREPNPANEATMGS